MYARTQRAAMNVSHVTKRTQGANELAPNRTENSSLLMQLQRKEGSRAGIGSIMSCHGMGTKMHHFRRSW